MPFVTIELVHPGASIPARATSGSAGYDLRACIQGRHVRTILPGEEREQLRTVEGSSLSLGPGERALIPLGFKARLPDGFEAQIRIRSSIAFRRGLTMPNAPGTIDADYPDEWLVMLRNDSMRPVTISDGERVAQAVLARYAVAEWSEGEVGITTERQGGVGSTGA